MKSVLRAYARDAPVNTQSFWNAPGMRFGLAAMVCVALAAGACLDAIGTGFSAAALRYDGIGPFGLNFPLHETGAARAGRLAEVERLLFWARWEDRAAWLLLGFSVLCAVGAGWQTRQRVRDWHWLTFLSLPALCAALLFADALHRMPHARLGVAVSLVLGVACPAWDLCVPRRGPGRVLAWVVLAGAVTLAYGLRDAWSR
jgi:hypothetical protein